MIASQLVFQPLSTQCVTGTNTVNWPIPLKGMCDGCVLCQRYTVHEAVAQYTIRKPRIPMIPQ